MAQFSYAEIWDGLRIYRHDAPNICAITFDDGPSKFTAQALDTLKQLNIPATFFILGIQVKKHPKFTQRIIDEGHELASHSYSHKNFHNMSREEQYADLLTTNGLLNKFGVKPSLFRPPYGKYTNITKKVAKELGLTIVLWSSDSRDWKDNQSNYTNIDNILGRPYKPNEARGIFLFHDTSKSTVDALPSILNNLYMSGCRKFVTVSQYIEYSHPAPEQIMTKNPRDINVWQAQSKAAQTDTNTKSKPKPQLPSNRKKYQAPLARSSSPHASPLN